MKTILLAQNSTKGPAAQGQRVILSGDEVSSQAVQGEPVGPSNVTILYGLGSFIFLLIAIYTAIDFWLKHKQQAKQVAQPTQIALEDNNENQKL